MSAEYMYIPKPNRVTSGGCLNLVFLTIEKIAATIELFSPAMLTKHATRDERLQVHTLAGMHMAVKDIAEKMSFTPECVYYILKCPVSPRKRKGRPPIFDAAKCQ